MGETNYWNGVMGNNDKFTNPNSIYYSPPFEEQSAKTPSAAKTPPQTSPKKVEGTNQPDQSTQPTTTLTYPESLNSTSNANFILFVIVGIADIGIEFTGSQRSADAVSRITDVTKNSSSNASKDNLTSLTNPAMQSSTSSVMGGTGYVPLSSFDGRDASPSFIQKTLDSLGASDLPITKKFAPIGTIIKLPMPEEGLNTTYGTEYADVSLGLGGALVNAVTSGAAFSEMAGGSIAALVNAVAGYGAGAIDKYTAGNLSNINAAGSKEALTRTVQNPRREQLFKGVNYRKFSYTFTLAANNASECSTISAIIKLFKHHMMPAMVLGSFYLQYPSEFHISYHYNEGINPFLHNIGACALETMNVSYGRGNWSTLSNGAPTVVQMRCDFLELEPLSRNRAQAGDL